MFLSFKPNWRLFSFLAIVVFTIFSFMPSPILAAERTMIVLDGSGSMWGQINGKPKLVIARETLRKVLKNMPANTELGLMAYGHRRKGDCKDIELIVPAAQNTANEIANRVDKLKFLGKTPLSEAVKRAAEELRYTEDKATVILITDGIETCKADVCAIGKSLEELGLDFTAHVVGFGLSKEEGRQVACLAENTGGKYLAAANADELADALDEAVEIVEVPVVVLPTISLVAVDQNDVELSDANLQWKVMDANGKSIHETSGIMSVVASVAPGEYSVSVMGADISGGAQFTVLANIQRQLFKIPVEVVTLEATLDVPTSISAVSEIVVKWTGPNDDDDYITIVKRGAEKGKYTTYARTKRGDPAKFQAPDALGEYEVRYVHGPTKRTLASVNVEVTPVAATLDVPSSIPALAEIEVNWTGPNAESDYITIVKKGAKEGKFISYARTKRGSPAKLQAPDGVGEYEIRYVINASKRTLASVDVEITEVSATLEAPTSIPAGAEIVVNWTGPNGAEDYITIVKKGAKQGEYTDYARTKRGNPAKFRAPDGLGAYEIRYVINVSKRTLASMDVELTEVSAQLNIIGTPTPGGKITVEWTGPNGENDFITIVEKGSPAKASNEYARTRFGSPATFGVPKALGAFEVRYVINSSKRILATVPVTLKPVSARITAPSTAAVGDAIEVTWTGPASEGDTIEIVAKGADAKAKPLSKAGTVQGSPLFIYVPEAAGDYEIRYKKLDTGKILARADLSVQ